MNTLIILAHGSRREESNLEIKNLTNQVKDIAASEYDIIECAYLELAAPNLLECIDSNISKGATKITIVPYFLNSGNHVKRDIPAMIQTATDKYPDCEFNVSLCIGMSEKMPSLILERARMS